MIRDSSRKITAISLCLLLAACGGGSDSPGNASNTGTGSGTSGSSQGASSDTGATGASGSGAAANGSSGDTGGGASSSGSTGSTGAATGTTGPTTGTSAFTYDETARFNGPADIKADAAGNLYVLDMGNKAIRRIAADGSVSTLPVALTAPRAMEIDAAGNLYVIDTGILYKVAPAGNRSALTSVGSSFFPGCLTIDRQGNLYVLLSQDGVPAIRRISTSGEVITQALEQGTYRGIAADRSGNLYVGRYAEGDIGTIQKIAPDGTQSVFATGDFADIGSMAFDLQGNLLIAQFQELLPAPGCGESNSCYVGGTDQMIRKIDANGTVTTVLSGPPDGSIGDVAYDTAFGRFYLAAGADGNIYAAYERKQAVYKVIEAGASSLIAGKPGEAGSSD